MEGEVKLATLIKKYDSMAYDCDATGRESAVFSLM